MDIMNLLEQANAHFQKIEYDRAAECLYSVLQLDPSNEDALLGMASINDALGRESCNKGDYKQANIYFSKAIEYDPEDEYAKKWLSKLERPVAIDIYVPVGQKDKHSFFLMKVVGHEAFEILEGEKKRIYCLPGEYKANIKTQTSNYKASFFVPASKKTQNYSINCSDGRLQILHVLNNLAIGYSSKVEESNPVLFENSNTNTSTKQKRKKIATTLIISGILTFLAVLSVLLVKYSPSSINHSNIESFRTLKASSPTVTNTIIPEVYESFSYSSVTLNDFVSYIHEIDSSITLNLEKIILDDGYELSDPNLVGYDAELFSGLSDVIILADSSKSNQILSVIITLDITMIQGNRISYIQTISNLAVQTVLLLTGTESIDSNISDIIQQSAQAMMTDDTSNGYNSDVSPIDWKGFRISSNYYNYDVYPGNYVFIIVQLTQF